MNDEPNLGKMPICPICGQECDLVYKDYRNEIIGCDDCLTAFNAYEEEECFPYEF